MGVNVYTNATIRHEDPRQGEMSVMIRLTRKLEAAEPGGELIAALDENRRFWTKLMAHLADDANQLPEVTRAQLISIGNWVGRYSSQVLAGKAERAALIDVNRSIIAGLGQKVGGAAATENHADTEAHDGAAHYRTA